MRASLSSALAVLAILPSASHAVQGVISDTLTSDEQGCRSLCGLNDACLLVLYQSECRECWQLDCTLASVPNGFTAVGKSTTGIKPTCDSSLVPKPREKGCAGAGSAINTGSAGTALITGSTATNVANTVSLSTTTSTASGTATSSAAASTTTGAQAQGNAAWRVSMGWLPVGAVAAANIVVAIV